jgi:hypothetical protein
MLTGPRPTPRSSRTRGLSGEDTEAFFASDDLGRSLIRPVRKDEKQPRVLPELVAAARRSDHLDPDEEPARPRTPSARQSIDP